MLREILVALPFLCTYFCAAYLDTFVTLEYSDMKNEFHNFYDLRTGEQ